MPESRIVQFGCDPDAPMGIGHIYHPACGQISPTMYPGYNGHCYFCGGDLAVESTPEERVRFEDVLRRLIGEL